MASRAFESWVFCQPGSFTPPPSRAKKLRNMFLRDRVVVGEDQHHRHGQSFHIGGPVVGRAHHPAHLVEELREALRLGPLLRELSSGRLHHGFGHCGADLAHAFLRVGAGPKLTWTDASIMEYNMCRK
jgi:hypothetical protein